MKAYNRYIENVLSGKELVGQLARAAVVRHVEELKRVDDPTFPLYFSEQEADKSIAFLCALRHPSGAKGIAGELFKMQDNQAFLCAGIFGWRRKDTHLRGRTKVYLEVSRKWGKSLFAAYLELYVAYVEGNIGGTVLSAATTRKQAEEVFNACVELTKGLRRDSARARNEINQPMANAIKIKKTGCWIIRVSAEAGDIEGKNPVCGIVDEYHDHPKDNVLELVVSGQGTWDCPLLAIITTAGFNKLYPCFSVERPNAIDVVMGRKTDHDLFAVIFNHDTDNADGVLELNPDVPEQAREILRLAKKSNPNLGSTPTEKFILSRVRDARNKGFSTRVGVLTKNFNCWLDAPKVWIPEEDIKKVMRPILLEEFYDRSVFVGVDLAATSDLTAVSLFAPEDGNLPAISKTILFLPWETISKRQEVAPYREWVEGGYITHTKGNIVDNNAIRAFLYDLDGKAKIESVNYDQWNAYEMAADLTGNGFNMQVVKPYYSHMSEPTKRMEKMIISEKIAIDDNPAMLWNFRNIALDFDSQDNIKPNKAKSGEKIDGVVAMIMAVFGWLQYMGTPTVTSYLFDEENELITI